MRNNDKKKSGSTIVEVIVSFMVVVIAVVGFSKVITQTTEMLNKSLEYAQKTDLFDESFYKKVNGVPISECEGQLSLVYENNEKKVQIDFSRWNVEKAEDKDNTGLTRYFIKQKLDHE